MNVFFNRIPYLWNNLPDALRTTNCSFFFLLRDYVVFFIKIGFLTLTTPMLPGLESVVSKVVR